MSEQTPHTDFDQIVKGNVSIEKKKNRYIITFSKIGKFLMYQVWDKDSVNLNKKRSVGYVSAKQWIKAFKLYNEQLDKNGKPLFTPTTIMETEDDRIYAFVIHKADINSHDKVVFTVSTKEIVASSNKLTQLPIVGELKNVRFDIDNFYDVPSINRTYYDYKNCLQNYPTKLLQQGLSSSQLMSQDFIVKRCREISGCDIPPGSCEWRRDPIYSW
jgi:hypothetical protein